MNCRLRLPALNIEDAIQYTLHHTSLKNLTPYEAISYTWGDGAIKKIILLDGKQMEVTKNLESALRYFHLRKEDRVL